MWDTYNVALLLPAPGCCGTKEEEEEEEEEKEENLNTIVHLQIIFIIGSETI